MQIYIRVVGFLVVLLTVYFLLLVFALTYIYSLILRQY